MDERYKRERILYAKLYSETHQDKIKEKIKCLYCDCFVRRDYLKKHQMTMACINKKNNYFKK